MNVRPNKLKKITISEAGLGIEGDINFADFVQLVSTALLEVMKRTCTGLSSKAKSAEEHDTIYNAVKRDVYDAVNLAMSNVLSMFAPDIEQRPDLTEEAIKVVMAVEDDIVKRAAAGDVEAMRIVTGNPDYGKEDSECEESSTDAPDAEQN